MPRTKVALETTAAPSEVPPSAAGVDVVARATAAFADTLRSLGMADAAVDEEGAAELGRRGALLASTAQLWRQQFGPLLDVQQVQQLLQVGSRQAVHDLVRRRRLLALPTRGGSHLYPAFQFAPDGRPYPLLAGLLRDFVDAEIDAYTTGAWFTTPNALLDGETPAAWLHADRDPERLREAARRSLARLGQ